MKHLFTLLLCLNFLNLSGMDAIPSPDVEALMQSMKQVGVEQAHNFNNSSVNEAIVALLNATNISPNNYLSIGTQLAQALIAPGRIRAKILLMLASRARDENDARHLMKLAGTVHDFGHFEVFLFEEVYDDVATQVRDELTAAIDDGNTKKLASLLVQGMKIVQLHLIYALRQKNEKMAKLLVRLGADVELCVLENQQKITVEAYARSQGCEKAATAIQKAYLANEVAYKGENCS